MSVHRKFWHYKYILLFISGLIGFISVVCIIIYVMIDVERKYISADATPLSMSLALMKENTCSRYSPEFNIDNIPDNTHFICLNVHDLNIDYDHGGGCVLATGASVQSVNAGALLDYRGPCPKSAPHSYRFRLEAKTEYNFVVGLSEMTLACCDNILE